MLNLWPIYVINICYVVGMGFWLRPKLAINNLLCKQDRAQIKRAKIEPQSLTWAAISSQNQIENNDHYMPMNQIVFISWHKLRCFREDLFLFTSSCCALFSDLFLLSARSYYAKIYTCIFTSLLNQICYMFFIKYNTSTITSKMTKM